MALSVAAVYPDPAGGVQRTAIAQGGNISGVAPFLVVFDASGTRSPTKTTLAQAFQEIGYGMDFGEAIGGTWPYSGLSKDTDSGGPILPRVFTQVGTHTVTYVANDGVVEDSMTFTVTVTAPPAATHIPVSDGAWPVWVDGTHYTLDRGGDYTSFGSLTFVEKKNIVLSATGSGADPIVGTIQMDNRNTVDGIVNRSSNIRTNGIDVANWSETTVGYDFCAVVGGRCRQYSNGPYGYVWDNDTSTEARANSVRLPRGTWLWDCGEVNTSGTDYVYIGTVANAVIYGCDLHRDSGPAGGHVLRGDFAQSAIRHNRFRVSVTSTTYIKLTGVPGYSLPTDWPLDDAYGSWDGGALNRGHPATQFVCIENNQFGDASDSSSLGVGVTPENNDTGNPFDALELVSFELNRFYRSGGGFNISLGGRNLAARENYFDSGAGSLVTVGTSVFPNRIPAGWDGPYITTGARPVPSAFA